MRTGECSQGNDKYLGEWEVMRCTYGIDRECDAGCPAATNCPQAAFGVQREAIERRQRGELRAVIPNLITVPLEKIGKFIRRWL